MIELNAERDVLRLSGYASLFERIDMSGDRVRRGAFAASILGLKNQKLPMLFGHETHNPIGVWDRVIEDKTGLFVSGRLISGSAVADRTRRLVIEGAISGLSIGYKTVRFVRAASNSTPKVQPFRPLSGQGVNTPQNIKPLSQSGQSGSMSGRVLLELDLWEVSLVAFPMLREARLTQIEDDTTPYFNPPQTGENRE